MNDKMHENVIRNRTSCSASSWNSRTTSGKYDGFVTGATGHNVFTHDSAAGDVAAGHLNSTYALDRCAFRTFEPGMNRHSVISRKLGSVGNNHNPPNLQIATANVCTLDAHEYRALAHAGLELTSRCQFLEEHFYQHSLHFVGIQENRLPGSHLLSGHHYDMYSSGATSAGNYGTELWVRRCAEVKGVMPVAVSSPMIWARIDSVCGFLLVFSAHAPHELSSIANTDLFWDSLQKQFNFIRRDYPEPVFVLCIDANAWLGSFTDACVGPIAAEPENDNGLRFRVFLNHNCSVAINTWHDAGSTWVSTQGHAHRNDYVCSSADMCGCADWCRVLLTIDLSLGLREDHSVVGASFNMPCAATPTWAPSRGGSKKLKKQRLRLSTDLMSDPVLCHRFQFDLQQFLPRAGADVDQHLLSLNEQTRTLAQKYFGTSNFKPRKDWISAEAWSLIRNIAPIRRILFTWRAHKRRTLMSYTLLAWAASATRTFVAGATEHSSGVGHVAFQRILGCGKCLLWASVGEAYCVRKFEFSQKTS